jgi:hypothetical protein
MTEPPNDPQTIAKLLRALATGSQHIANKHDVIFLAAAELLDADPHKTFQEVHERNMRLVGTIDALRNANEHLGISLKAATREIARLRGLS